MAQTTAIEWTDATWNPVTGCTRIGPGCENCHAARFAERWRGTPGHPCEQGFDIRLRPGRPDAPRGWARPRTIFINSMSDLFHKAVPSAFVDRVFDTMEAADHHVYRILTKRSSRMRAYLTRRYDGGPVPGHIWPGVSVESAGQAGGLRHLRAIRPARRFVSFEPLIGPVGAVDLTGIAWAIVGGESGPGARPMEPARVAEVRTACQTHGTAFFFKQWGAWGPDGIRRSKKANGRTWDGRTWDASPDRHHGAAPPAVPGAPA